MNCGSFWLVFPIGAEDVGRQEANQFMTVRTFGPSENAFSSYKALESLNESGGRRPTGELCIAARRSGCVQP